MSFTRFSFLVSLSLWVGLCGAQPLPPQSTSLPSIDFSYAGFAAGEAPIPTVPAIFRIHPTGGDDTTLIQAAIDKLSSRPPAPEGFSGAIEFSPGQFRVAGQLRIGTSGVVLRGSGQHGTVIVATGHHRRTLIQIGSLKPAVTSAPIAITKDVKTGAVTLLVADTSGLKPGDRIVITRPSTQEWIAALGMTKFPGNYANQRLDWTPGSRNLVWNRRVMKVEANTVSIDAPVTTALEARYGGGMLAKVESGAPIRNIGLENMVLESEFDSGNLKDEEHSWIAVALDGVEDAWVKDVVARGFAGSAVRVGPHGRRITIENSRSEQPVSEIAGYRRQSFLVEGGQVLVRRCRSQAGMNDFAVGALASGPNVFLDSAATDALGPSGSFDSWSSGTLYENVRIEGSGIRLAYDMTRAQGAGWTAANSIAWNCKAISIETKGPPDAPNTKIESPVSLYGKQLAARTSNHFRTASRSLPAMPSRAAEFRLKSQSPTDDSGSPTPLQLVNGRFVIGDHVVWGGTLNQAWWTGRTSPAVSALNGRSITRFVPGKVGPGLTEDLPELAKEMVDAGTAFTQDIPGLWYDRRRDEHLLTKRPDGNVWAPFYEMPWARSGTGAAWDGLSRFDLSKYNQWYFDRVREFAELAARNGLVVYHNLYNTHNVLEIPPHWIDYPWRPANNVNDTGLPEPPPIEEGKTLNVGNQFFSTTYAPLRALHRAYILHTLDELGSSSNIIFGVGFQFAGPLAFQQFFQDTVAEWEKRTGHSVRIVLTTSKDITDAILADPVRSRQVAVVNTLYWQYRPDGSLWAPRGGQNLAFRELSRRSFGDAGGDTPPPTSSQQVYRQVREYRDRFPEKAVVAWHSGVGPLPILMAGGAQALLQNPAAGQRQGVGVDKTPLDSFVRDHLASDLAKIAPRDGWLGDEQNNWCLAGATEGPILIASLTGTSIQLKHDFSAAAYRGIWFNLKTGETKTLDAVSDWRSGSAIRKPTDGEWLLLLRP